MSVRPTPRIVAFIRLLALAFATAGVLIADGSTGPRIPYDEADARAGRLLAQMTTAEKLELVSGHRSFFIRGFPRLGIPELYLSDATQGVHLRSELSTGLTKSVAFPCPLDLAATWNPSLAYQYARSIGEECRAGGVAVLLGPGMNIYRVSQCGRNFEYFGEDPFLAGKMIGSYVRGVLDTGTIPTLKHFVANNTDFRRRTSNSVVDERALHEIYLPAFKAGIDAGAMAVMTAYNQLNGEWCGQSRHAITDILRGELGFKWLVMTDWNSVWDAEQVIHSGQDLEMPGAKNIARDGARLLAEGRVTTAEIDAMARPILRTEIAMGLLDRPADSATRLPDFTGHEGTALQTAREGVVLLKNNGVLPMRADGPATILVTGRFIDSLAHGGGSADVKGYDPVTLRQALVEKFGPQVSVVAEPTDAQLASADAVVVSTGTVDSEGWDRPFALPPEEESRVQRAVALNRRTVVLVNSGGGVRMTAWNDAAAAILYCWYPGQVGNRAVAEILRGDVAPSGKLPITIEREFADSPGSDYLPAGEALYTGWIQGDEMRFSVHNVRYKEGVFVGYRWYDARHVAPLYAFGSGLSYTTFEYSNPRLTRLDSSPAGKLRLTCSVRNTGRVAGDEIAQLYLHPIGAPVPRPEKELKGFERLSLAPGESREVKLDIGPQDFAYWDDHRHGWTVAPGRYELWVGGASDRIALRIPLTLP